MTEPRGTEPSATESPATEPSLRELLSSDAFRADVVAQIGGWRGVVESSLPVLVFVLVNVLTALRPALLAAVATGLLIAVVRLVQRQSPRQALNGLLGLRIAALLALLTNQARNFYLPGIVFGVLYTLAFAGSLVLRRPLVGVLWSMLTGAGRGWQSDPALRRTFTWLTVVWTVTYALKVGAQAVMYALDISATSLGVARLALGYPPFVLLVVLTVLVVRRRTRVASAG